MNSLRLFADIFYISFGFILLYGLYVAFRVSFFIVKRYEKETNLSQTRYFRERLPWVKSLPGFLSSSVYVTHLLIFVWYMTSDRFDNRKKMGKLFDFDDIKDSQYVTSHFSKKEIKLAKRAAYVVSLFFVFLIAHYAFKFIWPELFTTG